MIRELDSKIEPKDIHCNFELAAINGLLEVFPEANIAGCYFRLRMQNCRKQIVSEGLIPEYNNDSEFASQARMIPSQAFVPIEDIEDALETMTDYLPESLKPILEWSSTASWIGEVSKIYVDGTFSLAPDLFSQIFLILAERPETVTPICYALMSNKSKESYCKMLGTLTLGWPNFDPQAISMDYERALMNAFTAYSPVA
ncbi:uncharacterized protein LOC108863821 [Galendromus occidentalis]|uniref:Uncharacterized protein LOC108863821 n=1 Tax=Galendromus occidentalis TaxID=34638 RepID=A0AAJ7L2Q9_9ACAR|nr:uncharacterized protein LOC108863821 [Galendromus occidentalis]